MTKKINSYEDLLLEKNQLEVLLAAQKELVRLDVEELKLKLKPAADAVSFLGKFFTREKGHALLNVGVNTLIDVIFKKVVLAKTGWFARFAIPFLLKNFSSHVIDENVDQIKSKIFSIFTSKNGKHKTATE